jgi:hypothetical protein
LADGIFQPRTKWFVKVDKDR